MMQPVYSMQHAAYPAHMVAPAMGMMPRPAFYPAAAMLAPGMLFPHAMPMQVPPQLVVHPLPGSAPDQAMPFVLPQYNHMQLAAASNNYSNMLRTGELYDVYRVSREPAAAGVQGRAGPLRLSPTRSGARCT